MPPSAPVTRSVLSGSISEMPFKSQAQRRKFARLLFEGKISGDTFEEWNRETGARKLPERVKRPKTAKAARTAKAAKAAAPKRPSTTVAKRSNARSTQKR